MARMVGKILSLSILLSHKDDFSSIENDNGEYILNPLIEYSSFTSILRSVRSNNPYKLFDQLLHEEINELN